MSLFRRDVVVCVLSSGSAGNCTYVGDGHAGVLIDAGLATKHVLQRLTDAGLGDAPLDAVLLTHEHSDHVGAAAILGRALAKRGRAVPFYATAGTREGMDPRCVPEGLETIEPGVPFRVRHLLVEPMPVPHDTRDPVAYRVCVGDVPVAVVTDLGKPTSLLGKALQDCAVAVVEFNHDEEMLMDGPYPFVLKQRIRGNHGHLSNRQGRELLERGLGSKLQHLVLAHLSEENNTPELAHGVAARFLEEAGAGGRVGLHVAKQRAALAPIRVEASIW